MRRASPGRAVRIAISSMPYHCAWFCGAWGVGCSALCRPRLAISGSRRYGAPMITIRCRLVGALAVSAVALTAISPTLAADRKKKHAAPAAPAAPAGPAARSLGQFDAWVAYASQDKTGKVCYLVGQPAK